MSQMFIRGVAELGETYVSVKRLEKFLQLDEMDRFEQDNSETNKTENVAVAVKNLTATWTTDDKPTTKSDNAETILTEKENLFSHRFTLDDINLTIKKGLLVGIVGPIGSGECIDFSFINIFTLELISFEQGKVRSFKHC